MLASAGSAKLMASLTALAEFSPLNCGQRLTADLRRRLKTNHPHNLAERRRFRRLAGAQRRRATPPLTDGHARFLFPKVTQTNGQRPSRPGRRFKRCVRIIAMKVSLKVPRKTSAFWLWQRPIQATSELRSEPNYIQKVGGNGRADRERYFPNN